MAHHCVMQIEAHRIKDFVERWEGAFVRQASRHRGPPRRLRRLLNAHVRGQRAEYLGRRRFGIASKRLHVGVELRDVQAPKLVFHARDKLLALAQPLRDVRLKEAALQPEADQVLDH